MPPEIDYRPIGINCHFNSRKLAELSDPIFYPGTQNTLADGRLCAAWDLKPGQEVLTHDFTQQKITYIEIETQGTRDKNCPVRIPITLFGTDHDFILSAEHRTLYPQTNSSYGGRFIKAKHLCNGTTIDWVEASFIDLVQIRFTTEHLILPTASQCLLTCAAKIGPVKHPRGCSALCNRDLTPQNPAGARCICPVACPIKTSTSAAGETAPMTPVCYRISC